MDEQPVALDGLALQAFVDHCIAHARQEWENEQLADLKLAAEPIREHIRRTAPEWNKRRKALLDAEEQRRAKIRADRRAKKTEGPDFPPGHYDDAPDEETYYLDEELQARQNPEKGAAA